MKVYSDLLCFAAILVCSLSALENEGAFRYFVVLLLGLALLRTHALCELAADDLKMRIAASRLKARDAA
jgi:hypothetical protein